MNMVAWWRAFFVAIVVTAAPVVAEAQVTSGAYRLPPTPLPSRYPFLLAADASRTPPREPDDTYSFESVATTKQVPKDPGPAPTFDPDDYVPYAKEGTARLAGQPFVKTSDDVVHPCLGSKVWLYPDTPYVRWMLFKWAYFVYVTDHDAYYGDPANLVDAPSILHWHTSDSILRVTYCAEETGGQFQFNNLAPGDYIAMVNVRVVITTSMIDPSMELGISPTGEMAPIFSSKVIHGSGFNDGWIVFGGAYKVVADGKWHITDQSTWFTAAHLSGGVRYDPKVKYPQ